MIATALLLIQLTAESPHIDQPRQKIWSWTGYERQLSVLIDNDNGFRVVGIQMSGSRLATHHLIIQSGNYHISINTSQL
jgi:hypothetical protein